MRHFLVMVLVISSLQLIQGVAEEKFTIDERWVCNIKKSCLECLRLPHCSWCQVENKCFSNKIPEFEEFCKDNATSHVDYGMSFEENAKCACHGDEINRNCYPPGVIDGPECSDRGQCECGRCVCDSAPDSDHPTKAIVGEFCEFDNFSCDGPKCNEGPYYIHQTDDEEAVLP